jgi:hypothetical protein
LARTRHPAQLVHGDIVEGHELHGEHSFEFVAWHNRGNRGPVFFGTGYRMAGLIEEQGGQFLAVGANGLGELERYGGGRR